MQTGILTDRRVVEVGGTSLEGLFKMSEFGTEVDSIEVAESKKLRLIGSGTEKILPVTFTFKILRNSATFEFYLEWREAEDNRDVVIFMTDKTERPENAWARILLADSETGGLKFPEYDPATPDVAQFEFPAYPSDIDIRQVG